MTNRLQVTSRIMQVAVCGIVNAGKSTLLNALQQDVTFETGVVRTTKEARTVRFSEDIELVDLPGLDANDEDNAYTLQYLQEEADILLLVHNGQEGELNAIEMNLFNEMMEETGLVLLVHTHMDVMDEEATRQLEQIVSRQLEQPVHQFFVDSLVYEKGLRENKMLLQEAGGVDSLKQYLVANTQNFLKTLHQQDEERVRAELESVLELKQKQRTALEEETGNIEKYLLHLDQALEEMNQLRQNLKEKPMLSSPGVLMLDARRTLTTTHSSEHAAESEALEIFDRQYARIYDMIDVHEKKWEEVIRSSCRYTHSEDSVPYQLEQRTLKCLHRLRHLGESHLANVDFQWKVLRDIRFLFDDVEKKEVVPAIDLPLFLRSTSSRENWSSHLHYPSHYISCNVDIHESIDYRRGLFGIEREVSTYRGSFYEAFREVNDDLKTITHSMHNHYEDRSVEKLQPFRRRIEEQIEKPMERLEKCLIKEKSERTAQLKQSSQKTFKLELELKSLQEQLT